MFQCKSGQSTIRCMVSNSFPRVYARRDSPKISGEIFRRCQAKYSKDVRRNISKMSGEIVRRYQANSSVMNEKRTTSASNQSAQSTNFEINKENNVCDKDETLVIRSLAKLPLMKV